MSQITVSELTQVDRPAWDSYVRGSPLGLPQHLSGWSDVMSATYGYPTRFLMATVKDPQLGERVAGVMPLYVVHSVLTGHAASTMPGGICADDGAIARALLKRARLIAEEEQATRLLIQDSRHRWSGGLQDSAEHEVYTVDIDCDEDELWSRLHRNIRRQIRIARRNELVARTDREGALLDDFYSVLCRFTHRAGTPVFGRQFLENIVATFPNDFNIVVIYQDDAPIGGYFQLEMARTAYGVWGAALHDCLELRPVYLAYWTILSNSIARGMNKLDMGRSPMGSNASKFKAQWGGDAAPIYQQASSLDGTGPVMSATARTKSDGKYRSFMQIWPRLPYPVTQYLGPKLRRHVPFA